VDRWGPEVAVVGSVALASNDCGSVVDMSRREVVAHRCASRSRVLATLFGGSVGCLVTASGCGFCSWAAMGGCWRTNCLVGARCEACGRAARSSGRARAP